MTALFVALLASLLATIRSRLELAAEILALRHQLAVLQRATPKRPRLRPLDRLLWVLLSSVWPNWRQAVQIVTPATVVRWHRRAFAAYWRWNSRPRRIGRPVLASSLRALIRQMRDANPLWGAPRIHGELQKLGIDVSQTTVAKYLGRRRGPPSPSWRTFLTNHVSQLASIDFFTVPTATFRVLFVFVVLSHDRRRIVHVNVTAHPTSAWTAQQFREAWPWDTAPRFVIRDRDRIYGSDARRTTQQLGVEEVLTAPRSPWQNPFVERVIGSLRRSVWITSSCGTSAHCAATCSATSCTTTSGALTCRWTKMRPSRGLPNRQPAARSSQSRTSAGCIITTNVAPPDRRSRRLAWPYCPWSGCSAPHTAPRSSLAFRDRGFPVSDLYGTPSEAPIVRMKFLVRSSAMSFQSYGPPCADVRRGADTPIKTVTAPERSVSAARVGIAITGRADLGAGA
jgi:putative transposase